jgi:SAM-dependent methyltransferase
MQHDQLFRMPLHGNVASVAGHYPAHVSETVRRYFEQFPDPFLGSYLGFEWNRLAFVHQLAVGDSVLDVGSGHGVMLDMLLRSGRHARLCGIDIRRKRAHMHPPEAEFHEMSVTALSFRPGEFDTVICMEVLEHLPPAEVPAALSELRRVAGRRLLLTVPYNEPFPLFHQELRSGHKQQFDPAKLRALFPRAVAVRLPGRRVDWVLIAEDKAHERPAFTLLGPGRFSTEFGVAPPVWVATPGWPRPLGAAAHRLRQRWLRARRWAGRALRRLGLRQNAAEPG